jgi:Zn finger protein HypA/HybF involved in hydrogenase expression
MSDDAVECQGCRCIWRTSELSQSGPIKEFNEISMEHTKAWIYVCPKCFSPDLKILIEIRIAI